MPLKINISNTGITKKDFGKVSDVVEEIHEELQAKINQEGEFCDWLNYPSTYFKSVEYQRVKKAAEKINKNSDVLVVIGIGGSYLGARAVIEALKPSFKYKDIKDNKKETEIVYVGNNLSSEYINSLIKYLDQKDFSINVISKSGTTTEPAIAFRIFRELLEGKYGLKEARERIYVTTDEKKGALRKLTEKEEYESFIIPSNIGGRFSVLTPVGLLAIATAGINIDKLMQGAIIAEDRFNDRSIEYNECYQYAVLRNLFYDSGKKVEILAAYEPRLKYLIEWWKQLFGESEGKDGKGLFPAGVLFTTDLHSLGQYIQDGERILIETVINVENSKDEIVIKYDEENLDNLNYLQGKTLDYVNKKAMEGTIKAHVKGGVPNIVINIDSISEESIGELIYFFEKAVAMSAELLEVNPFNQPGVEEYKTNMFKLLNKPGYEQKQ